MAGAPQQQSQGGDNALAPLWITILVMITLWLVWHFAHQYIVAAFFEIKLYQAYLVRLFVPSIASDITLIQSLSPQTVSFDEMVKVGTAIGNYMRYPFILFLIVFSVLLYISDITLRFRKIYTMKQLAKQEYVNWPEISPVLNLDLVNEDLDAGSWAMGLVPMDFAKKYSLIKIEEPQYKAGTLKSKTPHTVTVLKGDARKIFALQLGHYWQGVEYLPIHTKALFAIFAARINRDRDNAYKILKQISKSSLTGKLDFSGVDDLANKYKDTKPVVRIVERHAYVSTVMASMLERAREDGVVATAEFLWLKPVDRRLWYILNAVGRQTPVSEVSGAFAHWIVEKELGHKVMVPMVQEAVNALEIAIKEIKYIPKD
ncbi:MAG: type IVB secretion system coupling complex protein DotM/IcmP [Proteobacteria bacterium]|nr:type IVB secretion system coupling complex protein DotM/IcmP [Pseudomonadota bacterium]